MATISVIVPVYKVETYLERCVDSILNQTFRDIEVILVDDGSPDKCGEICDTYKRKDERIKVIHKKNGGLSSARNAGIDIASGEYIGFVDSDDWIVEDMFEYLIGLIEKYQCDIASISYILTKGKEDFKQKKIKVDIYNKQEALKFYLSVGMKNTISDYPVWIKLYKKSLFEDIRFPEGQLYEDVATNFDIIRKTSTYVKSNKIGYYYYQDSSSITRGGFKQKDMDILKVGNQLVDLALIEKDKEIIKLAKLKNARGYFSLLSKIAVYGYSEKINDRKKIEIYLIKNLRKNYISLIKSSMPLSRKIIMTLLIIDFRIIRVVMKFKSYILRENRK